MEWKLILSIYFVKTCHHNKRNFITNCNIHEWESQVPLLVKMKLYLTSLKRIVVDDKVYSIEQ
jgi:hypothetical protein